MIRNFSTNKIGKINNDENSRNTLLNLKSIPNTHRGEAELPQYQKADNTFQIHTSRNHSLNKINQIEDISIDRQSIPKKFDFKRTTNNEESKNLMKFKNFKNENPSSLARTLSRGNLLAKRPSETPLAKKNIMYEIINKFKKGNKEIEKKKNVVVSLDCITPRNNICNGSINQSINKYDQSSGVFKSTMLTSNSKFYDKENNRNILN